MGKLRHLQRCVYCGSYCQGRACSAHEPLLKLDFSEEFREAYMRMLHGNPSTRAYLERIRDDANRALKDLEVSAASPPSLRAAGNGPSSSGVSPISRTPQVGP